jgi:2-oxoglutarate dehydrogenase E2 component (dihydrolipoamide succinyltransferase)
MMVEIKVPGVGESVTEAILAQWFKQDGDNVKKGEVLFVIETDKVTLEVESEAQGILKIAVSEGETVAIGAVVGTIDTAAAPAEAAAPEAPPAAAEAAPAKAEEAPAPEPPPAPAATPAPQPAARPAAPPAAPADVILSPAVRRLVAEKGVDVTRISGTGPGGRVTKGDVLLYLEQAAPGAPEKLPAAAAEISQVVAVAGEQTSRKPMTPIRQRIAARLLEAKQNTAMLTTFNDVDMSRVMEIRSRYKDAFQKKFGVSLGFMSFFIKASVEALKEFPAINAFVDGKEIVYHHYYHIGVAIGTGKGLVVPVIRHCENLSMAQMEQAGSGRSGRGYVYHHQRRGFWIPAEHADSEHAPERHSRYAPDRKTPGGHR